MKCSAPNEPDSSCNNLTRQPKLPVFRRDTRSGITSDPNRDDDPQYITRLIGQVIRVSVETMKIANGLPKELGDKSATSQNL